MSETIERKQLGAKEMIDITRMRTLYVHKRINTDIKDILQVEDNNESLLAEIGQVMIDDRVDDLLKYFRDKKIRIMQGKPVPETNAVYCLFLPPYYLFTDLKREYK